MTKFLMGSTFFLVVLLPCVNQASADVVIFNSSTSAMNASVRGDWLAATGIASPEFSVDFESGFTDGQNVHEASLFAGGMILRDTGPGTPALTIRSGSGIIGGSNSVGNFSVTQDEQAYFEIDFSANPVDYVGFQDIDHSGVSGIITFANGSTKNISIETTGASGDTAEFWAVYRNDQPAITKIELNASGDGNWGLDHIEYGSLSTVPEPGSGLLFLAIAATGMVWRRRPGNKLRRF